MGRSDFSVEVVVKSNMGDYKTKIDSFKGVPEDVVALIASKYCSKTGVLSKMYKALAISENEMRRIVRNE
mgnify:CR=1 FL=1